jgi:predicted amidophosphoribosyltransferase
MLLDPGCVVCHRTPGPVCSSCADALTAPSNNGSIAAADMVAVCRASVVLDDRARSIVSAFKYRRQRRLASWIADRVAPLVPSGADAITWVPATPDRKRRRGYDQSRELAVCLARRTGVPARRLLRRSPGDQRQTGLGRAQRLQGPTLNPIAAAPPVVVLVDDVVTTGASLRSAAAALNRAGAARIVGVVFAATPPPGEFPLRSVANRSSISGWM